MKKGHEERLISELVLHLKGLRIERNLSLNKLSKLAGITRPAISLIESGKRIPTMLVCLKIAAALGERLSSLLNTCERKLADK